MCFYLEYSYLPSNYKIIIECERGVIDISVTDEVGKIFSPWMIYPGANYYHYEDKISDVCDVEELVRLMHQAIRKRKQFFLMKKKFLV